MENLDTNLEHDDIYPSSDQDEPMDTDSEAEDTTGALALPTEDVDPDVDSSVRMEISDNEDHDELPTKSESPSLVAQDSRNGLIRVPETNGNLQRTTGPLENNRTKEHGHILVQASFNSERFSIVAMDAIKDIKQPVYGLSIPLWQKILTLLPPMALVKLMRTTQVFHAMLSPQTAAEVDFQERLSNQTGFLSSENIWQTSRITSVPDLPKPLRNKTELETWQMLCGNKCQICQQTKVLMYTSESTDPWHAGPGENGMRIVWLCGARLCGDCLLQNCQQEVSLQISSSFPSFLIEALPPLFVTQHKDWIAESTLLTQPAPPHLQIRKLFFQPHIDAILEQFKEVKSLGQAAAEEWLKGLNEQRREKLDDATRWESWELKGGLKRVNKKDSPRPSTIQQTAIPLNAPLSYQAPTGAMPFAGPPFTDHSAHHYHHHGQSPMQMMPPMQYQAHPPPPYSNYQSPPTAMSNPQIIQGRPRRSLQEVNEARAARRIEIERRCSELDPPITAKVLSHMSSFQAALQISFPFSDKDWEVLKPRLLAQRETAEGQEALLAEQLKAIQTATVQPSLDVLLTRDPNELNEIDWELLQAPVRETIAKSAEGYIKEAWEGGSRIDHENVSHFAPDVLLNVRARYYEQFSQINNTNGAPHPRIPISLENMKWLYDNKVKTLAEGYQKELFQCSVCDSNSKFYGFEGVIQHYAAKHTTILSLGNIIVNWRTEWPDPPPFKPSQGYGMNGYNGESMHDSARSISASNFGEYGSAFQTPAFQQQPHLVGAAQYHYGYGPLAHQQGQYHGPEAGHYHLSQASPGTRSIGSHGYGHPNPYGPIPGADQGYAQSQIPFMPTSAASDLHRQQLIEMAQFSRDLWNATMGIKELSANVRVFVLIHHMSSKFERKFEAVPDISMFQHGLNENAQMRPIRSLNGLSCKTCIIHANPYGLERKSFTLPALVNHFKSVHLANSLSQGSQLDWRIDMIDLPPNTAIEDLVNSNGMDDRKFNLIAEAFPDVFPSPLPALSAFKETKAKEYATRIRLENLRSLDFGPTGNTRRHQQLAVDNRSTRSNSQGASQERLPSRSPFQSDNGVAEPAGEDEYDPSRPSYIGAIVEHSGLPRSASNSKISSFALPPGIVSLGVVDSKGLPESPQNQGGYDERLLRHHRGLGKRPNESESTRQENYSSHKSHGSSELPAYTAAEAADRFLSDLAPTVSSHYNHEAYANNAHLSVEDSQLRKDDRAIQSQSRTIVYDYPKTGFAETPMEARDGTTSASSRYTSAYPRGHESVRPSPPLERHWDDYPNQMSQVIHRYPSRERSRSPRRSLPREYVAYDPHIPQVSYEERSGARWRGESPPRSAYPRLVPERSYSERAGESFMGRDVQGRSVRYVAIPVDDYERHPQYVRYPPARAAETVQHLGRPGEFMEAGSDGKLYVVEYGGAVRYDNGALDDRYREYG